MMVIWAKWKGCSIYKGEQDTKINYCDGDVDTFITHISAAMIQGSDLILKLKFAQ